MPSHWTRRKRARENSISTKAKSIIIEKQKVPVPEMPSAYIYRPLAESGSIRMIKILPGRADVPIKITMQHRTISDMSRCSAVSYVWGSSLREHVIFCDGHELKVTENLFDLLKQFRASRENGLMWIDAICINQEDLQERSQQVSLMTTIYREAKVVLGWLGKEHEHTNGAFRIIEAMAREHDLIYKEEQISEEDEFFGERGSYDRFPTPSDIFHGDALMTLLGDRSWPGIIDLYFKQDYFMRLWVVQEIALSKRFVVICGPHRIGWNVFRKTAKLLEQCSFLRSGEEHTALRNINHLAFGHRFLINGNLQPLLSELINAFANFMKVTDPRDRIYGLLGILGGGRVRSRIVVDYTKSVSQVYHDATKAIILGERDLLSCFTWINTDPDSRPLGELPSWVPCFGDYYSTRFVHVADPAIEVIESSFEAQKAPSIRAKVLTVNCVILDSVSEVTANLSRDTIPASVLSQFNTIISTDYMSTEDRIESLWKALILFDNRHDVRNLDHDTCEQGFHALMSYWNNPTESSLLTNLAKGYEMAMKNSILAPDWDENVMGRPIFQTQSGLFGLGPAGYITAPKPATQVGDVIAVVSTVANPVVLRSVDGNSYIVVGNCYVGDLLETRWFQGGQPPKFAPIRIR